MAVHNTALCHYCEIELPRSGDIYCCDGCQTLAGLNLKSPKLIQLTSLDEELVDNYGVKTTNTTQFQCQVDAIACEACLNSLIQIQNNLPGLKELTWNRNTSTIHTTFVRGQEFPAFIFSILEQLHLRPRWLKAGNNATEKTIARKKLVYVGVTGALASNIMLFAIPVYTGALDEFRSLFEILQGLLFLPVFFWSAQPFYRSAWISLKFKQLNLDLPLVIAFITTAIASFYNLVIGAHDLYFDSLAGFLFLIIVSRYLVESSLAKRTRTPTLDQFLTATIFTVERGLVQQRLQFESIKPNDVLILRTGERLPVDGEVLSAAVEVDLSWMTGESIPRLQLKGSNITAGSKILSQEVRIRVTRAALDTDFAKIISGLNSGHEKIHESLESKIGSLLLIACFSAIAGLFIFSSELATSELLRRSIALLIVACPCAISFAAPLARAKARQLAMRSGFWLQDPLVWQRLSNTKKIAFDKTGTLTGGTFRLAKNSPLIDNHWKQIILSLENLSNHPIAASLRKEWGLQPLFAVEDSQDIPGVGVSGTIQNRRYQIRRSFEVSNQLRLEVLQDDKKVLELSLEDAPRENLPQILSGLQNYELYIFSGDLQQRVQNFAKTFSFKNDHVFGELKPDEKLALIKKIEPDMYLGDGTNDVMALGKAPVSIAVGGSALEAQQAADIIFLSGDLARLKDLFDIAHGTQRLLKQNFMLALTYNILAGAAALMGFVTPLIAAVLMPVASLLLLLSTLNGNPTLRQYAVKK